MRTTIDRENYTFNSESNTLHLHYDWQSDEGVSMAIIRGIATVTNTPPAKLDPLQEDVNVDALNQLYRPVADTLCQRDVGHTKLRVNDCTVVVYSNGKIEITPPDEI